MVCAKNAMWSILADCLLCLRPVRELFQPFWILLSYEFNIFLKEMQSLWRAVCWKYFVSGSCEIFWRNVSFSGYWHVLFSAGNVPIKMCHSNYCKFGRSKRAMFGRLKYVIFGKLQHFNSRNIEMCHFWEIEMYHFLEIQMCHFWEIEMCHFPEIEICHFQEIKIL